MNSSKFYIDYLDDILQAIEKAQQFTANMSFDDFKNDYKTKFAVIRAFEIIGEAANRIPKNIQNNHQNIPWSKMKGMRNKLIHDYMSVNTKVVWETIRDDLPGLKIEIEEMKNQLNSASNSE
jgi:uncharacterized protein with HEPN domain